MKIFSTRWQGDQLRQPPGKTIISELYGLIQYRTLPVHVREAVRNVRARRLTYLSVGKLVTLVKLCLSNEQKNRPGIIVEMGCALGGSSIALCAAKRQDRELRVYDIFGMIPPPSDKDGADVHERYETIRDGRSKGIGGDVYYGYAQNLYDQVRNSFAEAGYPVDRNHVSMIKGLLQDTLDITEPVSLAHIDVDWYDPVLVCLQRIEPWLISGGAIVIDDYFSWSGCRHAVEDYFSTHNASLFDFNDSSGSLVITKH